MSGTQGGDDGMGDDEGLMDEIKAKLKDPYLMDLKAQKVVSLTLSPESLELHDLIQDMLDNNDSVIDLDVRQLLGTAVFEKYIAKLLEYLDEIYYIEKRRGILETGEEWQPVKLMPTEKERLNLKASECAYAYSGVLFKTVWKPHLKWESVISFILKLVKEVYKAEKNASITERVANEAARLLRTSNFNRNERDQIKRQEERKVRVLLRDNLPRWSNMEAMQNMITLRNQVPKAVKSQLRTNLQKGSYKPYNMKPSVLKSKDTNSILLACILPNVKDKRLVEYRMKSQSVEKERLRSMKGRVAGFIGRGLDKITSGLNHSNMV